jgi:polysaccharide transporter, PST family
MNRWRPGLKRLGRSGIVHNAIALYGIQGAAFILPLVTLPYLARVLGPGAWGGVMFAQAFSIWLSIVVGYGFAFSGTRAVAREREDRGRVAEIVASVQGAKAILFVLATVVALVAWRVVPFFDESPAFLLWAWLAAVLHGLSPLWFYQGVERLKGAAALDVLAKAVGTLGIFVWVRSPEDAWRVLALRAAAELISTGLLTAWMYRSVAPVRLRVGPALGMLRDGWALFVFTSAASVYTSANAFLLGLMASPREVGFFGAGERIVRAASMLLGPISQALYPRVSHLVATDPARAREMIRRSLLPFAGLGAVMGAALFLLAPLLTQIVFGPDYAPVTAVIRVLALIPVLLGLGTVLGIQWALSMGLDRIYTRFVLLAGALNVGLAILLVPHHGAVGMAVAAVLAELSVEAGLVWLVFRRGGETWSRSTRNPAGVSEPAPRGTEP